MAITSWFVCAFALDVARPAELSTVHSCASATRYEDVSALEGVFTQDAELAASQIVSMLQTGLGLSRNITSMEAEDDYQHWASFAMSCVAIAFLACVPLVLAKLEEPAKRFTKVAVAQMAVYYIWLFGGLYVLAYRNHFSSPHFSGVERDLDFQETVYLLVQIATTVGYGDITPANHETRAFMAAYILVTLLVVASMVIDVAKLLVDSVYYEMNVLEDLILGPEAPETAQTWWRKRKPKLPLRQFIGSLVLFALVVFLFMVTFTSLEGETNSNSDAFYMAIVTFSTIGLGDFTADTKNGDVLAALFMLIGVPAFGSVVLHFSWVMSAFRDRELWHEDDDKRKLEEVISKLAENGRVDAQSFVRLSLLHQGLITEENLVQIDKVFKSLGPDADGTVSTDSILSGPV